jgi:hypothetical protein
MRVPLNVLVSRKSAPAARYAAWMSRIMAGRVMESRLRGNGRAMGAQRWWRRSCAARRAAAAGAHALVVALEVALRARKLRAAVVLLRRLVLLDHRAHGACGRWRAQAAR